jgi:HSP20 family molecular chaperone IbpA
MKNIALIKADEVIEPELVDDNFPRSTLFDDIDKFTQRIFHGFNSGSCLEEKQGNFILQFEIPGFDESEIDITIEGTTIFVRGISKNKQTEFSYQLPQPVVISKATSIFKNGILTVVLPKSKIKKQRILIS